MTKPSGQTMLLGAVVVASCALVGYLLVFHEAAGGTSNAANTASRLKLTDIPFNGQRAYDHLKELCDLGSRPSGSEAMLAQQRKLAEHFEKLGGKVSFQKFKSRHPLNGEAVPMANMLVEWHPERRQRILLCTHYDTRPFPDQDPHNPRGTFVGANDGGSGTALLMELARSMPALKGNLGVDFLLLDGEEFVFGEHGTYFIGAEYFATQYVARPPQHRYRYGVLLDMVGDADLQIFPDRRSMSWDDTRPLVDQLWRTASRLGVREFGNNRRYDVLDDHIKLHDIAGISCIDIIDFKYPAWHTEGDTPDKCSALSLAKVGWVVEEWLKQAVKK